MISYVISLLLKIFNSLNVKDFYKIDEKLKKMEREFIIILIVMAVVQILGFIAILVLLEDGFHWNYLIKF